MPLSPRVVKTIKKVLSDINFDLIGYHFKMDLYVQLSPYSPRIPSLKELAEWEAKDGRLWARSRLLGILLLPVPAYLFWLVWMTLFHQKIFGTETYAVMYNLLLGKEIEYLHESEVSAQFWMFVESRRRAIGRLFAFEAIPFINNDGEARVAFTEVADPEWRVVSGDEFVASKTTTEPAGDPLAKQNHENVAASSPLPAGKKAIELTAEDMKSIDTQTKYRLWGQAYKELKQTPEYRNHSKRRIVQQIAKLPVARGSTRDYIYRHMKDYE